MIQITVPFNKKSEARALGAKVIDGSWCIPDDVTIDKKRELIELFGDGERIEESPAKASEALSLENVFSWDECFNGSTLFVLNAVQNYGLPEDKISRGKLFRRLSRVMPGDYPVTYEGFVRFYPELETIYPKESLNQYFAGLNRDYKKTIEENRSIPDDIKGLLLFILP